MEKNKKHNLVLYSLIFILIISFVSLVLNQRISVNKKSESIEILKDSIQSLSQQLEWISQLYNHSALVIDSTTRSISSTPSISTVSKKVNMLDNIVNGWLESKNKIDQLKTELLVKNQSSKNQNKQLQIKNNQIQTLTDMLNLKDSLIQTTKSENDSLIDHIYTLNNAYKKLTFKTKENVDVDYFGFVVDNQANGFGMVIFAGKGIYTGDWKNNFRHGKGQYKWANGDVYTGEYEEGVMQGFGMYQFISGEKYEGEWKNNLRHGKGKFYNSEGKLLLDGDWVNDKFKKTGVNSTETEIHNK